MNVPHASGNTSNASGSPITSPTAKSRTMTKIQQAETKSFTVRTGGRKLTYVFRPRRRFSALLKFLLAIFGGHVVMWPGIATAQSIANNALPTGGQVQAGAATLGQAGNAMTINQTTSKVIINYSTFNIGKDASVTFNQPSASSVALNQVTGSSDASQILGRLSSNGSVWLQNAGGVYFGKTAVIDVGSIVGTSLKVNNDQFMNGGTITMERNGSAGAVINEGSITAKSGGYVALIAPQVSNSGVINAPMGTVRMAAGDKVSVDIAGDGLIKLNIDKAAADAVVTNSGNISANGGVVVLSARSAGDLASLVVNNTGIIEAKTLGERNGKIFLDGGTKGIVETSGSLLAKGDAAGTKGGSIQLAGEKVGVVGNAVVDASGHAGGGTVLIGGNYKGENTTSIVDGSAVANAQIATVTANATIKADAIATGDGGKVILWSDDTTRFAGSISAKGGAQNGAGGFVETSGKKTLQVRTSRVDTSASDGTAGQWLLDPTNITIVNGADTALADAALNPYSADVSGSTINDGDINAAFATTNVAITTASSGFDAGNVVFQNAAINNLFGNKTFTVTAQGKISGTASTINANTPNALGVTLTSGNAGIDLTGIAITNRSNVLLTAGTGGIVLGNIDTTNSALSLTSGGAVSQATGTTVKLGAAGALTYSAGTKAVTLGNANEISNLGASTGGTTLINTTKDITINGDVLTQSTGGLTVTGAGNISVAAGKSVKANVSGSSVNLNAVKAINIAGGAATIIGSATTSTTINLLADTGGTGLGGVAIGADASVLSSGGVVTIRGKSNVAEGVSIGTGVKIISGAGNVSITGVGADTFRGVYMKAASKIDGGTVDISGASGGAAATDGVRIESASVYATGSISVSGVSNGTSAGDAAGVALVGVAGDESRLQADAAVSVTGVGSSSANAGNASGVNMQNAFVFGGGGTIRVVGTQDGAGPGTGEFIGVRLQDIYMDNLVGGAISITGKGGQGTGGNQYGVQVISTTGSVYDSIISTDSGDITISGIGRGATGASADNHGVAIQGANIYSASGNIGITGTGGSASGSSGVGVLIAANAGAGALIDAGGAVFITGQGGAGGAGATGSDGIAVSDSIVQSRASEVRLGGTISNNAYAGSDISVTGNSQVFGATSLLLDADNSAPTSKGGIALAGTSQLRSNTTVVLRTENGVSQAVGSKILSTNLLMVGLGNFNLVGTGNAVTNIAGDIRDGTTTPAASANVNLVNTTGLNIDTINATNTYAGATNGFIGLQLALPGTPSANNNVTLNAAAGNITQANTAIIRANSLVANVGGAASASTYNIVLNNAPNELASVTLSALTGGAVLAGNIFYRDLNDVAFGNIITNNATTPANVALRGVVRLESDGGAAAVTQTGIISARALALVSAAGSNVTLNGANDVATLAATTGALTYGSAVSYEIGTVNSTDKTKAASSLNGIAAGTAAVTLNQSVAGKAVTQTQAVTTTGKLTLNATGSSFDLDDAANNVGTLTATTGNSLVNFRDANGLIVDGVNTGTAAFTLRADAGTVTQTNAIVASNLNLQGAATSFVLNNVANDVTTLTADDGSVTPAKAVTGLVQYTDANAVAIGDATMGLTAANLDIVAGGAVTQGAVKGIELGTGALTVRTNTAAITLNNKANTAASVDLQVRNVTNTANAAGAVTYFADNNIAVNNLKTTTTGDLRTTAGSITQANAISVGGNLNTLATTGITLDTTGNVIGGFAAKTAGGNVQVLSSSATMTLFDAQTALGDASLGKGIEATAGNVNVMLTGVKANLVQGLNSRVVSKANGAITLTADNMELGSVALGNAIDVGGPTGLVTLDSNDPGRPINFISTASATATALSLGTDEIATIANGTLSVGSTAHQAGITVTEAVALQAGVKELRLLTNQGLISVLNNININTTDGKVVLNTASGKVSGSGIITANNLSVDATDGIVLNGGNAATTVLLKNATQNDISYVSDIGAANTVTITATNNYGSGNGGTVSLQENSGNLVVSSVNTKSSGASPATVATVSVTGAATKLVTIGAGGINTTNGKPAGADITINADDLDVLGTVNAGTAGTVRVDTVSTDRLIDIGAQHGVAASLKLTAAEAAALGSSAKRIVFGSTAHLGDSTLGSIVVSDSVTFGTGVTLTSGGFGQAGQIDLASAVSTKTNIGITQTSATGGISVLTTSGQIRQSNNTANAGGLSNAGVG
ncbi:MAG: filamentous hemagglutinin N-terminal domain-containing protein, partial [Comamonadaceae bacterium]